MEDLKLLWDEGVKVFDTFLQEHFILRCMLFITFKMIIRLFNACVQCLENTTNLYLRNCKKIVYMGHQRFLPKNSRYRKMKEKFDSTVQKYLTPLILMSTQINAQLKELKVVHGKEKFKGKDKGKARTRVVLCALFGLYGMLKMIIFSTKREFTLFLQVIHVPTNWIRM